MPQYSNIETPAINMVTIKIIMDNFNLVEDFNIKNGDSNRTITKTIRLDDIVKNRLTKFITKTAYQYSFPLK